MADKTRDKLIAVRDMINEVLDDKAWKIERVKLESHTFEGSLSEYEIETVKVDLEFGKQHDLVTEDS